MSTQNIKKMFDEFVLPTYTRVGPVFVKGKGSWLWDEDGERYLDLFPGWGVSILGHCPPSIVKAVREQTSRLIHLPNNLFFKEQALLAKEIVKESFSSKVFFANSGAEAVEGALKFSRLFGAGRERYEIVTMKNSFHGRTFGALSATGQEKYKAPFKPLLPMFREANFNDFDDFLRNVTDKTVGVILELIQGEGGVNVASNEYISKLYSYCQENKLLFIADEVQTGVGRTGTLFCHSQYDITPDIMVLSKGLGAGVPISAFVVKREIADLIKPGMHASTFGGSPLVTHAALEVFKTIKREKLLENAKKKGKYLIDKLNNLKTKYNIIKEVRGKGLMIGVELNCEAQPIFKEALKRKLVINATHVNVLRLLPALNVKKEELDKGIEILEDIFKTHKP